MKEKQKGGYITWIPRLLPVTIIERNNVREYKCSLTEHDFKALSPEGC